MPHFCDDDEGKMNIQLLVIIFQHPPYRKYIEGRKLAYMNTKNRR